MSKFQKLYEFEELKRPCSNDRNCKLADLSYGECGQRHVFVYSSRIIWGDNEKHLLAISEKVVSAERELGRLEECLGAQKPPRGICWKKQCEIIHTWRN